MGLAELGHREIIGNFYMEQEKAMNSGRWESALSFKASSDQASETYKWLGNTPMMEEWVGPRGEKSLRAYGQVIENKLWSSVLGFNVDELRRDKTKQIMMRVGEHAERAVEHIGKLMTTAIINAESTVCYDGQFYFDTDHSENLSGTQTNDLTVTEVPALNVATATAPTADEMANIIVGMLQHQFSYKDDQGEPINGNARNFILMVPVAMWAAAFQAITMKNLNVGTGVRDNPVSGLGASGFNIIPIANPRLTWTTKIALFRADGRAKPFIYQEEYPVKADIIGENSEYTKLNRRVMFLLEASYNVGYGLWQHATLGTLS